MISYFRRRALFKRASSIRSLCRNLEILRALGDKRLGVMFSVVAFGMGDGRGHRAIELYDRRMIRGCNSCAYLEAEKKAA